MSGSINFPGLSLYIPELPETLRGVVEKLYMYGYTLSRNTDGIWTLKFPNDSLYGYREAGFSDYDLGDGLVLALRQEETQRGVLIRYEQFDSTWGSKRYGNAVNDTTIKEGGCGPTSLAIVMQYLMNDGSRQRIASYSINPAETASYAATHGRVSATRTTESKGTAGDPMIKGIRDQWPGFDGTRVTLREATDLIEEGHLIIFLCKGCKGLKSDRKKSVSYEGHFMVLSGVEGALGPKRLFRVLDPAKREKAAMWFITQHELAKRVKGFWWVYRKEEMSERSCSL